jgi:ankyrin repeat protein
MFKYITKILQPPTTGWSYPWRDKQPNLAQMRTVDNRTPLAVAVCHPKVTENIIRSLLNDIRHNPEDLFGQASTEPPLYQIQIFVAIEQVARRRLKTHDHLHPLCEACNADMFNQTFHFPCRYNNVTLLQWLIEQSSKFNDRATHHTQASDKVDLNKPDYAGYTPLLTAVFYGSIECVKHLLLKVSI